MVLVVVGGVVVVLVRVLVPPVELYNVWGVPGPGKHRGFKKAVFDIRFVNETISSSLGTSLPIS